MIIGLEDSPRCLSGLFDQSDLGSSLLARQSLAVVMCVWIIFSQLESCFTGAVEMSHQSPVASWLCAMLHCFGSYILADMLLGEAPIDYFSNNSSVLLATAVWYLIFFCPMNLFYKCVSFLPVKLIFVAMKEVVRVRKIAIGVHHAHHHYHHGWFIMVVTGWVKAAAWSLEARNK
uniref:Trimeric intracellular cation channel type A n=1 Tax=Terrapene triunguis TaxID=2587831 RepID=A0A674J452_9SAUR